MVQSDVTLFNFDAWTLILLFAKRSVPCQCAIYKIERRNEANMCSLANGQYHRTLKISHIHYYYWSWEKGQNKRENNFENNNRRPEIGHCSTDRVGKE